MYFLIKAQSEISPHRRSSQSTTPSEEAAEGFICPGCMSSFPTPQDLEVHYDKEHLNGNSSNNGNNLGHLKEEVQELQTTLKEEQFYSAELKKEVERLSTAVHKSTEDSAESTEVDLYETQIKALTEAKDLRKFMYLYLPTYFEINHKIVSSLIHQLSSTYEHFGFKIYDEKIVNKLILFEILFRILTRILLF